MFSPQLQLFKKTRSGVYNFRCPYCGDSETNSHKRRGFLYETEKGFAFKCHNCGHTDSFHGMLKHFNHGLFIDMMIEVYGNKADKDLSVEYTQSETMKRFSTTSKTVLHGYSPVKIGDGVYSEYLLSRGFTGEEMARFYAIPNLAELVTRLEKFKDSETKFSDDPAIGIPYFNGDSLAYIQVRRLTDNGMRYITFECDGGHKLFGLNDIDTSKRISILEGAFDSVFVQNSVAVAGAQDVSNTRYLESIASDLRFIYDKDYQWNKDIMKLVEKTIIQGHSVVIYDKWFKWKDMNDAILDGVGRKELNDYLDTRTFKGMAAKLQLSKIAK